MAIAITLLVLELNVPDDLSASGLRHALRGQGHELLSIVLSFFMIGRLWISHHRLFQYVEYYDTSLLVINGVFLLSVALVPFPTEVLGTYPEFRTALILYAISISVAGLLFSLLWVHVAYIGLLVPDGFDRGLRRYLLLRFLAVPVVFLVSIPVAAVTNHLFAVVAMWVVLPPLVRYVVGRFDPRTTR